MEIVGLNFGQCGLQIANVFWTRVADQIRKDRSDWATYKSLYRYADAAEIDSENPNFEALVPRCILVDTEMGPATQVLQESDSNLISSDTIIAGTESTGNNWATAFKDYGSKYSETIEELVEKMVEDCDHLEYFNLTFAVAGGTGSGLGSYAAQLLSDLYPKVPRLVNVVTNQNVSAVSPYNNLLCLGKLEEYATVTVPFSNEAILQSLTAKGFAANDEPKKQKTYFENINSLISDFQHKLNVMTVDLKFPSARVNAIVHGLVPFEGLNYTSPFKSPLKDFSSKDTDNLENVYNELFRPHTRIAPIPHDTAMSPMAISVLSNGDIDHLKHIKRLKLRNKMYGWNREGVKVNIKHPFSRASSSVIGNNSIIALVNHTGISQYLDTLCKNVETLLRKKAFLHHFSNLVEEQEIWNTLYKVSRTSDGYKSKDAHIRSLFDEIVEDKLVHTKEVMGFPKSIRGAWPTNRKASLLI